MPPIVTGVTSDRVWVNRVEGAIGETPTWLASLDDLIAMKQATGRSKDLEDLRALLRLRERQKREGGANPKSQILSPKAQGLEWEQNPEPGRIFPWGNEPDPELANYVETGIGTTSPVGCFPGGAGPYGVEDLSAGITAPP
jgi:hypothetical protein